MMNRPVNLRDLGGMKADGGRCVKHKRLLRSGEVCGLSEADKRHLLEECDLKTIVDLRTVKELAEAPDDVLPGVQYRHIDVLEKAQGRDSSKETFSSIVSADVVHRYMQGLYADMMTDPKVAEAYRQFVQVMLEQEDGAVLFHCFAGKDRTGIAAAIALTLLGASWDDIMADYLLTNEMRKEDNRRLLKQARSEGTEGGALEALEAGFSVDASYLQAANAAAVQHYGSFAGYCKTALRVCDAEVERLREGYLE